MMDLDRNVYVIPSRDFEHKDYDPTGALVIGTYHDLREFFKNIASGVTEKVIIDTTSMLDNGASRCDISLLLSTYLRNVNRPKTLYIVTSLYQPKSKHGVYFGSMKESTPFRFDSVPMSTFFLYRWAVLLGANDSVYHIRVPNGESTVGLVSFAYISDNPDCLNLYLSGEK